MTNSPLANLAPQEVWKHFASISAIPRPSGKEEKILSWIKQQVQEWQLTWRQDDFGNLVVFKQAFPGYEERSTVVLQSHVDMVTEKNYGISHDFENDPIRLKVEGDWVTAHETTLGADNGLSVAAMLAILEDKTLRHGPLQCLFTVEEESGLTGAKNLDASLISGRFLLNMDSGRTGHFTIGCAGGVTSKGFIPLTSIPSSYAIFQQVFIKGLVGGHSGVNIHESRGNALILAGRLLSGLQQSLGQSLQLAALEGGNKHNAIPREAMMVIGFTSEASQKFTQELQAWEKTFQDELGLLGKNIRILSQATSVPERVFAGKALQTVLDSLILITHGVRTMSHEVTGLVETSINLASLRLKETGLEIITSQRSNRFSQLTYLDHQLQAYYRVFGGTLEHVESYPSWTPRINSSLQEHCRVLWKTITGKEAVIDIIHAGLESGLIGEKCPGMDMISFGPNIQEAHTPQERLGIASVELLWKFLKRLLEELR